jgi:hypothetical protein
VGLPGRGAWDDDQGNQMLAMLLWVRDGQVPAVGPISSLNGVHHGVEYYWLLAPGAFLTDANPVAAAVTLAVIGVGGVAATWWLGRTVGGSVAGHVAGLLMAVSPSAIDASTFIWNSNVVAPAAALATAAAWHAFRTRRARWWLIAAIGATIMLHGHLLSALALPPLLLLLAADLRRRPRDERRRALTPVLGACAIVAAGYLPMLVHELANGFAETRALATYLGHSTADAPPLLVRPLIIVWRIEVWPVAGPTPTSVLGGLPAAVIASAALVIGASGNNCLARQFSRWAIATLAWTVAALTLISPGLAAFVKGLPNDQYYGWLMPIVLAVIGVSVARLATRAKVAAVAITVVSLALSLAMTPPLKSPDGGWPDAATAAERIQRIAQDKPTAVVGVAKNGAALAFPLIRDGKRLVAMPAAEVLVVTCDPVFEESIRFNCGGEAETAVARQFWSPSARSVDQFIDSPRRTVGVFVRQ